MTKFKDRTYGNIWLTHEPVHPMELEFRVGYNIHGHIHNGYVIEDKRYIANTNCNPRVPVAKLAACLSNLLAVL